MEQHNHLHSLHPQSENFEMMDYSSHMSSFGNPSNLLNNGGVVDNLSAFQQQSQSQQSNANMSMYPSQITTKQSKQVGNSQSVSGPSAPISIPNLPPPPPYASEIPLFNENNNNNNNNNHHNLHLYSSDKFQYEYSSNNGDHLIPTITTPTSSLFSNHTTQFQSQLQCPPNRLLSTQQQQQQQQKSSPTEFLQQQQQQQQQQKQLQLQQQSQQPEMSISQIHHLSHQQQQQQQQQSHYLETHHQFGGSDVFDHSQLSLIDRYPIQRGSNSNSQDFLYSVKQEEHDSTDLQSQQQSLYQQQQQQQQVTMISQHPNNINTNLIQSSSAAAVAATVHTQIAPNSRYASNQLFDAQEGNTPDSMKDQYQFNMANIGIPINQTSQTQNQHSHSNQLLSMLNQQNMMIGVGSSEYEMLAASGNQSQQQQQLTTKQKRIMKREKAKSRSRKLTMESQQQQQQFDEIQIEQNHSQQRYVNAKVEVDSSIVVETPLCLFNASNAAVSQVNAENPLKNIVGTLSTTSITSTSPFEVKTEQSQNLCKSQTTAKQQQLQQQQQQQQQKQQQQQQQQQQRKEPGDICSNGECGNYRSPQMDQLLQLEAKLMSGQLSMEELKLLKVPLSAATLMMNGGSNCNGGYLIDPKQQKKVMQMIRNRISAQNSRDRKKAYINKLESEKESQALEIKEDLRLTMLELQRQTEENQRLEGQLEALKQQIILSEMSSGSCSRSSNSSVGRGGASVSGEDDCIMSPNQQVNLFDGGLIATSSGANSVCGSNSVAQQNRTLALVRVFNEKPELHHANQIEQECGIEGEVDGHSKKNQEGNNNNARNGNDQIVVAERNMLLLEEHQEKKNALIQRNMTVAPQQWITIALPQVIVQEESVDASIAGTAGDSEIGCSKESNPTTTAAPQKRMRIITAQVDSVQLISQ